MEDDDDYEVEDDRDEFERKWDYYFERGFHADRYKQEDL